MLALVLTLFAGAAGAHAFLDHASPAVGATVPAPREVSIWFTERVEPAFSGIEVTDAAGARVDQGGTQSGPGQCDVAACRGEAARARPI